MSALIVLLLLGDPLAEPADVVKDRKAFFPWRRHGPLKGTAVGVLASDVGGFVGREGRAGPPDAMGFSAGGDSYRWVYVPVTERPLITDLTVEVGGKKRLYPKLGMANAALVARWGVDAPFALVEVQVNDGDGASPGEGFVATKMTRLDGGRRFALDVTKAVEEAKRLQAADLKMRPVDAALGRAAKDEAVGGLTGPRETRTVMHVSWLSANERLRVAFLTAVTDGEFRFITLPDGRRVRYGVGLEAELGAAYEFDRRGRRVRTQTLPVEVKARR